MNMREKIARAILSKVPQGYGMTEAEASEYADAALDALMDATPEMIRALKPDMDYEEVYTAMIRAAKEGK